MRIITDSLVYGKQLNYIYILHLFQLEFPEAFGVVECQAGAVFAINVVGGQNLNCSPEEAMALFAACRKKGFLGPGKAIVKDSGDRRAEGKRNGSEP